MGANCGLRIEIGAHRWTIGGYVNNIGDATVIGQSFPVTCAAVPTIWGILRPPRTYGVRAGLRF